MFVFLFLVYYLWCMEKKSRKIKDVHIGRVVDNLHSEIELWNEMYPNKSISFFDIVEVYQKKYDPGIVLRSRYLSKKGQL